MPKSAAKAKISQVLVCPVCLSDRLDPISSRMSKCESCGFIWNHEVSDRDNLMLIVEHQTKLEKAAQQPPPPLQIVTKQKPTRRKKITK